MRNIEYKKGALTGRFQGFALRDMLIRKPLSFSRSVSSWLAYVGHPELVHVRQHQIPCEIRVDAPAMVGIGGHYEFPLPHAEQIVLAHQPVDALRIGCPSRVAAIRG